MSNFRNPHRKRYTQLPAPNTVGDEWSAFVGSDRKVAQILIRSKTPEQAPAVCLFIQHNNPRMKGYFLDLTRFTLQELLEFQKLVTETIELAIPVAEQRDRKAEEDAKSGWRYDPRLYRGVSTRVDLPWAVGIDSESICERLAYDAERDPPADSKSRQARVDSPSMVEFDSEDDGTEDDSEAID